MEEPTPVVGTIAGGITLVDTRMAGFEELNSVYVVASEQPTLVETGPGSDEPVVCAALADLGIGPDDLAHVVVTHVHMDHAGGAGALLERFPTATLWVHERGARHVVDPSRLIASTARTYGEERMRSFFGETRPCPAERVRAIADGDRIDLGDRALEVISTPGHASHHVALLDTTSGAMFTGEAIGSHLPWADWVRIREWSERVRNALQEAPDISEDDLTRLLTELARVEYEADARASFDLARYDAIGSIRMNAQGLARYWRTQPTGNRQLHAEL
jgi:glyoxylase-like metal-dependent hydrolase (beta-lactamase superfamily II)